MKFILAACLLLHFPVLYGQMTCFSGKDTLVSIVDNFSLNLVKDSNQIVCIAENVINYRRGRTNYRKKLYHNYITVSHAVGVDGDYKVDVNLDGETQQCDRINRRADREWESLTQEKLDAILAAKIYSYARHHRGHYSEETYPYQKWGRMAGVYPYLDIYMVWNGRILVESGSVDLINVEEEEDDFGTCEEEENVGVLASIFRGIFRGKRLHVKLAKRSGEKGSYGMLRRYILVGKKIIVLQANFKDENPLKRPVIIFEKTQKVFNEMLNNIKVEQPKN